MSWGKCEQGFRRMAARNKPAGIRSLVYGMGKGKAGIEGLSVLPPDLSVCLLQKGGTKISNVSIPSIERTPAQISPLNCDHLLNRLKTKFS
jgi:hypothetical protein